MDEEFALEITKVYEIVVKVGAFVILNIKTANVVKVVENSQCDVSIAFMNEVAIICDELHIDIDEVLSGMNTKLNALSFRLDLIGEYCIVS